MKLAAYSHSAADKVQKHPKKSSLTTNVTETSFLHALDPPDHSDTIYIFDHFFTYIHNLDFFVFFQQILPKKLESRVRDQPDNPGHMGCRAGQPMGVFLDFNYFGESAAECEYAANFTDVKKSLKYVLF